MGGPAAGILLGSQPDVVEIEALGAMLKRLGDQKVGDHGCRELCVETTKPIGGTYSGDGCPFGIDWVSGTVGSMPSDRQLAALGCAFGGLLLGVIAPDIIALALGKTPSIGASQRPMERSKRNSAT